MMIKEAKKVINCLTQEFLTKKNLISDKLKQMKNRIIMKYLNMILKNRKRKKKIKKSQF